MFGHNEKIIIQLSILLESPLLELKMFTITHCTASPQMLPNVPSFV